jgi:predicted DNA-binding transcriptional regulator YafY
MPGSTIRRAVGFHRAVTMQTPSKLQRWLDIIAYLVGRRLPVTADELLRNVPAFALRWTEGDETARESARRTFERDKDELRGFGIPIRTVKYRTNYGLDEVEGYQIDRRDFYLPYLRLVRELGEDAGHGRYADRMSVSDVDITEADAPLALEALRRVADVPGFPFPSAARSAFRKLAFDIDPHAFAADSPVLFVDRPGAAELAGRVRVLADALRAKKRVRFRYHGIYRDETTERSVDGYGLLFQHGHWYFVGHDHARGAQRVFRVGRMDDVEPNARAQHTPDYEIPADFRLDTLAGREAWDLGDPDEQPIVARVRFHFPLSLWAERNGYGEIDTPEPGGAQVRSFRVHQVNPFLRWLLSLEAEVELLDPPELGVELRALAARVAAAHAGGGDEE